MVACTRVRSTSNVTIGIQPEDGQRILREFPPDTTLAQALMEIHPNSDLERAVLIYMHREVCVYTMSYFNLYPLKLFSLLDDLDGDK